MRVHDRHRLDMAIIDFTEIPEPYHGKPVGKKSAADKSSARMVASAKVAVMVPSVSPDLDAFEKFASEFFTHVCGCTVIEAVARGQDGGRDLVVEGQLSIDVNGKFLVSCKHKASSGKSVNTDYDEPNVKGRLDASGAQFFVGFYSTIASTSLRRHLEDTRRNHKEFDFLLFNSADIESRLISLDEPRGWLLAARYFPKSMGNLFRHFVVPINYYKPDDVKQKGSTLRLDGPYGETVSMPADAAALDEERRQIAERANDALTSHMHTVFFCDALTDFIRLLPNAFVRLPYADPANLELGEVAPNYEAASSDLGDGHQTTLRIVAAVWSFWDGLQAMDWLVNRTIDTADTSKSHDLKASHAAGSVTIGQVSRVCDGQYRDILARLIAFCPASLAAVPIEVQVVRNGKRLGWEQQLVDNFKRIVSALSVAQRQELDRYGGRHADENGWRQLVAILGREELIALLDTEVATALRSPPASLGEVQQPLQIGFDRTAYNQWLEECLGLRTPPASRDVLAIN